tara:strand:- start:657 stop:1016 length:360 start_codon:yes stop_codon:yes gene_type:complete
MHPFRANQYLFTEVAPFPEVKFPLKIDKSWSGYLRIGNGWGDWVNTSGNMTYHVESKEDYDSKMGLIKDCWKIRSKAIYPFGVSYLDFLFNSEIGFVRMDYLNYEEQKLTFELIDMIEN